MHRAIHYLTALVFALFSFLFLGQVNALPVVEDEKVLAKRTFSSQNCPTNVGYGLIRIEQRRPT
jgi:hypothetical protein